MKVVLEDKAYIGGQVFSNYKKYPRIWNYNRFQAFRYYLKIGRWHLFSYGRLLLALLLKKCYYGPFKGEFGNFLGHNLPFLTYLYSKGVKIHYCGMLLHKPFLVNEKGESIIYKYYGLRDFFTEVAPRSNVTIPPADVQLEIDKFEKEANSSPLPFFNIGNTFYYWFIHRTWILNGFMKTTDYSKVYKTKQENSVVIFPRSKGAAASPNNGEPWNWEEVARTVSPYFDKVYVLGHPAFSSPVDPFGNVEVIVTDDNARILEKCCNSKLIITQHSGTCYLGEYTNTPVLIIFQGKFPILGINDSIIFKEHIGKKHPFAFSFSMDDIRNYVKTNYPLLQK